MDPRERSISEVLSLTRAPRSLGWRLVIAFVAVCCVTAGLFFWVMGGASKMRLEGALTGRAMDEAKHIAARLDAQLAGGATLTREEALKAITAVENRLDPDWDAAVLDENDAVLAEGSTRFRTPLGPEIIEVRAPVASSAGQARGLGTRVRVRVDPTSAVEALTEARWVQLALAALAIAGAVAGIYFVTERWVLSPVKRLVLPLQRLAAGGAYEPVEPRGGDEIATLTAQVNGVVAALMEREDENRSAAATLELVKQQVPDVIYRYDPNANRFEFLSDSFTSVTGCPREEALADPRGVVMSLVIDQDRERVRAEQRAHLAKGPGHGGLVREARVLRRDGQLRWIEDHLTPEFDGTGRLVAVNGVLRDITAQKASEQAIRRFAALNRAVTDTALDAMITLDTFGTILTANPAAGRLSGRNPDSLVGVSAAILIPPKDRAPFETLLATMRGDGATPPRGPFKVQGLHESGREIPLEAAAGVADTPDGRVLTIVARDLTHQQAVEAQLIHAQKMEAVGTLAGGVAHDFNNLLSVIVGHAELARGRQDKPEKLRESLDAIVGASERGAELTSRLLGFARSRPADVRGTDVAELVNRVRHLVARTLNRAIEIIETVPSGLPPVLADTGQIELAILNLCINARDAMPRGGVLTLSAAVEAEASPAALPTDRPRAGPWVRLSVTDTGSGILPEVRAHLFEPFFTTKERGRGTGLGLAMVYGVVVNGHGGRIGVATEPGQGSRFDLYLPVSASPAVPRAIAPGGVPPPGTETILVVDDDDAVRTVISDGLREFGYEVVEAADGPAGLEALAENPLIRLVVLDMVLPKMGGREVFRRMRAARPGLPVLLSTGYSEEGDAREILRQGGDGILMKPYLPAELARTVREVLDKRRRLDAPR